MLKVSIMPPVVKKSVSVKLSIPVNTLATKAVLLGASGEQLKQFSLPAEQNELSLDGFAAGNYTLRVEAGNEVTSEQIIIPL